MPTTPTILQLLQACADVYDRAAIVAGPDGRDGASITRLPDGSLILAFRGTLVEHNLTSALDWLNDFHADLVSADGFLGRVHAGFLDALNGLWPDVFDAIEHPGGDRPEPLPPHPANPSPWWKKLLGLDDASNIFLPAPEVKTDPSLPWKKNLWITGHSKGGALAQLAGVRLKSLKPRVVTFAAPMAGDLTFAGQYPEEMLTRYESTGDIVPFLPPIGYRAAGAVIAQEQMPQWLRRLKADRLVAEWDWKAIAEAHHLSTYLAWLSSEPTPPVKEAA